MASLSAGGVPAGLTVLFKRVRIETANLEQGMYVAQLDRPWIETPFLFQGFEIRDDEDLKQLRHYCRHVYVDITRSSMPREKVLRAQQREERYNEKLNGKARNGHAHPLSLKDRLVGTLVRLDPTGLAADRLHNRHYQNVVATRKEAPRAAEAYTTATAVMNDVLAQIKEGRRLEVGQVREAVTPMIDSVMRNQDAMAWLVYLRKRDEYSYQHSIASSVWAVIVGRHLGFDRQGLDTLAMGGMLLDIGKAKLPQDLVLKEGSLSDAERELVRRHVEYGVEMAKSTPGINADVLAMIESHHERHDGSGYPRGLKGNAIPVFGRISGLVDCFDAMTTKRSYAPAKSAYDAIRELNGMAGTSFQRELVEQFVQAMGMFPTGSLVELNTGEVGIVIEQNRVRRLRPKLMLLLGPDKNPVRDNRTLDLRKLPAGQDEDGARWILRGLEPGAYGLDPKDYFV